MKQILIALFFFIVANHVVAQDRDIAKITDSLQAEGKTLYKSEMASWYGTEVFLEKCKSRVQLSGGYLSYDTGMGMNNIFFSKGSSPTVLATISFGDKFDPQNFKLDTISRKLTVIENDLYIIRQKALSEINKDTLFKKYNNAELNLIPIIKNGFKRVYILTGPKLNGTVIIGNDYLMEFNAENDVIAKRKLHKNILFFTRNPKQPAESAFHTHLPETGDFITATDICTLMLYERSAGWKFHVVTSKNYVSSWNCITNQLVILTKEAWDRIYKSKSE